MIYKSPVCNASWPHGSSCRPIDILACPSRNVSPAHVDPRAKTDAQDHAPHVITPVP
jgi:hypothetical protein